MKTTYLVREVPHNEGSVLIEVTKEGWHQIVEENKRLPSSQKRRFIADIIAEGQKYDCLVIEVGYEEYMKWHTEKKKSDRSRKLQKNFQHISLSSELLEEIESSEFCAQIDDSFVICELEKALEKWNTWAVPVYQLYMSERKNEVIEYIMTNCGVSKATAYRYSQSFKEFVKNFLGV